MQVQTLSNGIQSIAQAPSSRRAWLRTTGSLSAVAIAMLGGKEALAQGMAADPSKDVGILNVALGLEHEAINAYQLGAGSGLLQKPVLDIAVSFQGHHKGHCLAVTDQRTFFNHAANTKTTADRRFFCRHLAG